MEAKIAEPSVDDDEWDENIYINIEEYIEQQPIANNKNSCIIPGNNENNENKITSGNMSNNDNITQFLKINRIESLQSCFNKHDINMNDLNIWTEQDAIEYCQENKFGVHIKRRLINAISNIHSNQLFNTISTINSNINTLQIKQTESDKFMKSSFNKISKQLLQITSIINNNNSSSNLSIKPTLLQTKTTRSQPNKQKPTITQIATCFIPSVTKQSSITHKPSINTLNNKASSHCPPSSLSSSSTTSVSKQFMSKCPNLSMTFNQSTKKYELNLRATSPNISSFFERKYGSERWLKITTSEFDIAFKPKIYKSFMEMAINGVLWNNKIFKYCCHKDNILYFFHETDDIKLKDVRLCLGDIYSLKTIAKFASRISLGLSKTFPLNINIKSCNIHIINDIISPQTKSIMTDGCGYIAVNLAKQIPNIAGGWIKNGNNNKKNREYPLLIQCRIIYSHGLAKGVLIANPNIPDGQIHLRDSMVKIRNSKPYDMEYAVIEINNTSSIGHSSTLNTSFNIILSELTGNDKDDGLFRKYIDGQLKSYFESLREILSNPRIAYLKLKRLLTCFEEIKRQNNGNVSDLYEYEQQYQLILEMIFAGQNINDPYLQINLQKIMKKSYDKLLYKTAIPIENSTYLMGVADPLNILTENQVFIIGNNKIIGDVLISRNPCQHPGDIRVFNAVNIAELHDFSGYYNRRTSGAIFFSIKGERAPADLLSNGDYDGDLFWICWDQELVKIFNKENYIEPAPIDFADPFKWNDKYNNNDNNDCDWKLVLKSPMEFNKDNDNHNDNDINKALMTHFILTNCNSMTMKRSSTNWRKLWEEYGLFDTKTLIASQCYFVALDAAKNGIKVELPSDILNKVNNFIFPYNKDFDKKTKKFHNNIIIKETNSILMFIFEKVKKFKNEYMDFYENNDNQNIMDILDKELLFILNDDNICNDKIIQKAQELDENMTVEFVKLKQKYEAKNELIGLYDNDNLKQLQHEYNNNVFLLKKKYQNIFKQYCIDNNLKKEIFAKILYEYSYKKVFESNTRNSYWIPWIICGDLLNSIKANSDTNDNNNAIIISPVVFKDILLRKRR